MNHLGNAVAYYKAVRERIQSIETDIDEITLADTVEGLTDLHDIIAAIIRSALLDEALVGGIKNRIKEMQERLARFEERAAKRRHIARDVMREAEIKKVTAPDLTVSLRPGMPSLVVMEEALIPEHYWEAQAPRLRRQELVGELKQGKVIPGVQLSSPESVLSVRGR